jgi:hypothetical protein
MRHWIREYRLLRNEVKRRGGRSSGHSISDGGDLVRRPAPKLTHEQAEVLSSAAANHQMRLGSISDIEWKMTVAFWAILLTGSLALIAIVSGDNLIFANFLFENSAFLASFYLIYAAIFVYAVSANQARSMLTERNRFVYYQNAAMEAVALPADLRLGFRLPQGVDPLKTVSGTQIRKSTAWSLKLLTCTALIFTLWLAVFLVAASKALRLGSWGWWSGTNLAFCSLLWLVWLRITWLFVVRAGRSA